MDAHRFEIVFALHHSAEMHGATQVGRDDIANALLVDLADILDLFAPHGDGSTGHFHAESPAESATFLDVRNRDVVEILDIVENRLNSGGDSELAPPVAPDVERDFVGE